MNPPTQLPEPLRVALLEDDALLRQRVLLPGLSDFGFSASGHETAASLYEYLQANPVDIVILDVGLPDQDGFSVARQLRTIHASLGIVMLTGRSETPRGGVSRRDRLHPPGLEIPGRHRGTEGRFTDNEAAIC